MDFDCMQNTGGGTAVNQTIPRRATIESGLGGANKMGATWLAALAAVLTTSGAEPLCGNDACGVRLRTMLFTRDCSTACIIACSVSASSPLRFGRSETLGMRRFG